MNMSEDTKEIAMCVCGGVNHHKDECIKLGL